MALARIQVVQAGVHSPETVVSRLLDYENVVRYQRLDVKMLESIRVRDTIRRTEEKYGMDMNDPSFTASVERTVAALKARREAGRAANPKQR